MPVMSDRWIIEMAERFDMIKPFAREQVRPGISYGVSSYGYDICLADEFQVLKPELIPQLDPKQDNSRAFVKLQADSLLVPANSFVLGRSAEYFKIPRDIITVCFGKSTYARSGVVVNVTPFEPEWEGFATISISNTAPVPVRVYAREGIAQLLFLKANETCLRSYHDKKGKYQAQAGITMSKAD